MLKVQSSKSLLGSSNHLTVIPIKSKSRSIYCYSKMEEFDIKKKRPRCLWYQKQILFLNACKQNVILLNLTGFHIWLRACTSACVHTSLAPLPKIRTFRLYLFMQNLPGKVPIIDGWTLMVSMIHPNVNSVTDVRLTTVRCHTWC